MVRARSSGQPTPAPDSQPQPPADSQDSPTMAKLRPLVREANHRSETNPNRR